MNTTITKRERAYEKACTHKPSGAVLAKPLLQPNVDRFCDVFPGSRPWEHVGKHHASRRCHAASLDVGPYCAHRGVDGEVLPSFDVSCADWVLSRLAEHAVVGNDQLFFEIIDHDNGWSLVVASYNKIIGNFYLAYVKTSTIP